MPYYYDDSNATNSTVSYTFKKRVYTTEGLTLGQKEDTNKEMGTIAKLYGNLLLCMSPRLYKHIINNKLSVCVREQSYNEDRNLGPSINNTRGIAAVYFYDKLLLGQNFPNHNSSVVLFMEMSEEFLDANIFRMFFTCKSNVFIVSVSHGLLKQCQRSIMEAGLKILGTAQIDKNVEYETFIMVCKWAI